MNGSKTLLLLLFTLAAFSHAVRADSWHLVGPGGGGAQYNPTICASRPSRVFVTSDMTGHYVSEDGGSTWRNFNLRSASRFVVCDPLNADTAYVSNIGLWRTTDGARTWHLVYPDPASVQRVQIAGDHAEEQFIVASGSVETVQALAVDPANSSTLYAVMAGDSGRALYTSTDFGKTWTKSETLPDDPEQGLGNHTIRILVDPNSDAADRRLYVITLNAVSVREHGTWTAQPSPSGVNTFFNVAAGFPADGGKPVIYVTAGSGGAPDSVWRSADGGATWQRTDSDMLAKTSDAGAFQFTTIAACFTRPEIAYLSYWFTPSSSGSYLFGVAKTTDGGRTWSLVWRDINNTAAPNMSDPWMNERFGPGWGGNPFALEVGRDNPDVVFATDSGRTIRTTDGGATWTGVYSHRLDDGTFTTTGLDVTTNYSVHFDPFDQKRVFIGWTDIGMLRSEDGGAGWTSATRPGVPDEWKNTTYWVEFDPAVNGRMWAATSAVHDLPRPKMWRSQDPAGYQGGIVTSTDGGRSWTVSNTGIGQGAMTHVLLDPSSPVGNRILYACAFGKGVFKSVDNGRTWTLKNRGVEGAQPFAFRIVRAADGTLYLIVSRRSERGEIGDRGDGAVYRSTDGAENWHKLTLPAGCNGPTGLLLDPKDSRRIALSAWGRATSSGPNVGGGIFISNDAGGSWRSVLSSDQHIYDVTLDPLSGAWYAGGFESSIYRSADRGETWTRIRGYNFKWGHRVIPDPRHPGMLFVTTFGGSVWYGPAAGDPAAVEDIVEPAAARLSLPAETAPARDRTPPRPPDRRE